MITRLKAKACEFIDMHQERFLDVGVLGFTSWVTYARVVRGSIIVLATLNVATVILAESSLSFLGLGVPPTTPTWGGILSDGRNYITYLGDWLRDYYDPRLRRI